jgi:ribosomal protein L23
MKRIDLYNVLITPLITEKANTVAEKTEQVVFKVLKSATKADVKQAFELVFNANSLVSVVDKPAPRTNINPDKTSEKLIIEYATTPRNFMYNGVNKKADKNPQNLPTKFANIFFKTILE